MRRLLALTLLIPSLLLGGGAIAAGLTAPAALAAGTTSVASPSLNLSNAEQNASAGDTTTVASSATSTSTNGGLSGTDALLIAVVAVALITGIAFWVWRDSRRHAAQVGHAHEDPMYGGRSHPGSKTPHKPRKLKPAERKRRKRGKAR